MNRSTTGSRCSVEEGIGDCRQVSGDAPVLRRGHLRDQAGNGRGVRQEVDQGFGHQAGGELIFEAAGQVHVQRRRRLPLQQLQFAAGAAGLSLRAHRGRGSECTGCRCCLLRDVSQAQDPEGDWSRHSQGCCPLQKVAARNPTRLQILIRAPEPTRLCHVVLLRYHLSAMSFR